MKCSITSATDPNGNKDDSGPQPLRNYKCPFIGCSKLFKKRSVLQIHARVHLPTFERVKLRTFPCVVLTCGKAFFTQQQLRRHGLVIHAASATSCKFAGCGAVYQDKYALKSHVKERHFVKKPISCGVIGCGAKFSRKSELKSHNSYRHNTVKSFKCPHCSNAFKTRVNLSNHIRTHGEGEECGFCHRKFMVLKLHIANAHMEREQIPCSAEGCGFITTSKKNLRSHVKQVHERVKKYDCYFCGRKFVDIGIRKRHLRTHTKEVQKVPCNLCFKLFSSNPVLENHIRATHTGEKPFRCQKCDFAATSECNLSYHRQRHHNLNVNRNKCYFCGSTFLSMHSLLIHIRSHTLEKPFKCKSCGDECRPVIYASSSLAGIRTHLNTRHWQRCPFPNCHKKFRIKAHLVQHMRYVSHPMIN